MSLYYACWLDNMDGCASVVKFPSPPGFLDDEVFGLVPVEVKDAGDDGSTITIHQKHSDLKKIVVEKNDFKVAVGAVKLIKRLLKYTRAVCSYVSSNRTT